MAFRKLRPLSLAEPILAARLRARIPCYPVLLRHFASSEVRVSNPLRILFCGSDRFSCASLSALDELRRENPELVRSIDVVVRPPKPTGRGLKEMRSNDADALAKELGLPVWERETFTGWNMPRPDGEDINLIVAVSFGLWIPKRLLTQAKYGGLNIHPSLLPQLRGAAPLNHTILHGLTHTGVTLQTLSTEGFDRGERLLQLPPSPGLRLSKTETPESLLETVAPIGAKALVTGIRTGLHVPPYEDHGWAAKPRGPTPKPRKEQKLEAHHQEMTAQEGEDWGLVEKETNLILAPKISKRDQRIIWSKSWTSDQLLNQYRAFGGLFTKVRERGQHSKPPVIPRYVDLSRLKDFVAFTSAFDWLDEKAIMELAQDHRSIIEACKERKPTNKDNLDGTVKHMSKNMLVRKLSVMEKHAMTQKVADRQREFRKITTTWLKGAITAHTPTKRSTLESMIKGEFLDIADITVNEEKFVAEWFSCALRALAHVQRSLKMRASSKIIYFDEPELLSQAESEAVRKRFTGTDVGLPGGSMHEEQTARKSDVPMTRPPMCWLEWIDPLKLGRNQLSMGGPRFKESKTSKKTRKLTGDNLPVIWDDSQVRAFILGQVWFEADYLDVPKGFGPISTDFRPRPENASSILVPATKGSGTVRVKRLREGDGNWEPAARVIKRHLVKLKPEKIMNEMPAAFGGTNMYEGVELSRPFGPPLSNVEKPLTLEEWRNRVKDWHEGRTSHPRPSAAKKVQSLIRGDEKVMKDILKEGVRIRNHP